MKLIIETDGLCQPDGLAIWAFVAIADGEVVHYASDFAEESYTENATNNVVEFVAVWEALIWLMKLSSPLKEAEVRSVNHLIVNQSNGDFYCRSERLRPYCWSVQQMLQKMPKVALVRVGKEDVKHANELCRKKLDEQRRSDHPD